MEPVLDIRHLSKSFGKIEVLKGINTEIKKGEVVVIIGPSGSGKSTFLRTLNLLEEPTGGHIYFEGTDITDPKVNINVHRQKMGMVFQYSALFDSMSVGENVAFGLRERMDYSEERIQAIVKEKLELVGLPGREDFMPGELSGGMKKRVSLARAIAVNPDIIFYDEPSSGLDPIMSGKIDELIIETQRKLKVTSLVVTHDMVSACTISDRIAMIYEGEMIAVDTPEAIMNSTDPRIKNFVHYRDFSKGGRS